MRWWVVRAGAGLLLLAVAAVGVGAAGFLLPGAVHVGVDETLPVSPERVFPLLVSVDGIRTWWTTPGSADGPPIPLHVVALDGPTIGRGTGVGFAAEASGEPFERWRLTEARAGRRVEYDVDFGVFVVHRVLTLTPVPDGTLVRWTEEGFVENPLVRWVVWLEGTESAEANFRGALRQLAVAAAARPEPVSVAVTFDDLPYQTEGRRPTAPPERWGPVTDSILTHLREAAVPAAVFANGDACAEAPALVPRWRAAGATIGNHTATHVPIDRTPPEAWAADVTRSHDTLVAQSGGPVAWFRYPYLRQGDDLETVLAAEKVLTSLGERNAPVTVATAEWYLAQRYDAATTDAEREVLTEAYLTTTSDDVAAAVALTTALRPTPAPQILLLHVNQLEADHLGDLLVRLAADGVRFVALDDALRDPIYAEPTEPSPAGLSWLVRLRPEGPDPFGAREEELARRFPTPP